MCCRAIKTKLIGVAGIAYQCPLVHFLFSTHGPFSVLSCTFVQISSHHNSRVINYDCGSCIRLDSIAIVQKLNKQIMEGGLKDKGYDLKIMLQMIRKTAFLRLLFFVFFSYVLLCSSSSAPCFVFSATQQQQQRLTY